jgi:hypothetical protein
MPRFAVIALCLSILHPFRVLLAIYIYLRQSHVITAVSSICCARTMNCWPQKNDEIL